MPRKAAQMSYYGAEDKGRRQAPSSRTKSEDIVLRPPKRKKLVATARDHYRNYALMAWAIRRHLDYVSKFSPLVRTGNDELDNYLESRLKQHGKKRNFDVAKRHSRDSMMRLFEMLKVTDGDCGLHKVEGGYLQGIEGDRIREAEGTNEHGLTVDNFGATTGYAVWNRDTGGGGGFEFAGMIPADQMCFDGFYSRFDQTRGISPLASALNMCTDAHEAFEWTQLKIKFHAILGLQINRATTSEATDGFPTTESLDYDTDANGVQTAENRYEFDPSGLTMFDMDPGESVQPIESNTPAQEFTDYSMLMIRLILLALDIPYTAFDSMSASFSARIADREEYEKSAQHKRKKNCEILEEVYEWILGDWWMEDATLRNLATGAGIASADALNDRIEWTGQSTPWLDKLKEVNGDAVAIANGLDSRSRIVKRRHGVSFEDIARELAAEENLADELGLDLVKGNPGQQTIAQIDNEIEGEEVEAEEMEDGEQVQAGNRWLN